MLERMTSAPPSSHTFIGIFELTLLPFALNASSRRGCLGLRITIIHSIEEVPRTKPVTLACWLGRRDPSRQR